MPLRQNPTLDRALHWLFEMSLVIKGGLCSAEAVAGIGLLLVPNQLVARLVDVLTRYEIAEDPTDTLATWTRQAVAAFSVDAQHFYGLYLLAHGGLKLAMVVMLWARILWAYPLAMVVLAGFVVYQLTEFVRTGAPFLLVLSGFDLVMIALVIKEYRVLRAATLAGSESGPVDG